MVPVPVSVLTDGALEGEVTVKVAVLPPSEVGLRATLMVQAPPVGRTLVEQVSPVMTNSLLERSMVKGPRAPPPELVTVNVTAGPVAPTGTEPMDGCGQQERRRIETLAKTTKCRWQSSVNMLRVALNLKKRPLAGPTLVLVFGIGCSSGLDNRRGSDVGTEQEAKLGQSTIRFRNPEMATKYAAAKASPRSFDPVYAYAKAVTDASLASLAYTNCEGGCAEGAGKYKERSELDIQYWPIVEDALSMLEALGKIPGLAAAQMEPLVATEGRLLWLAGRSVEEQTLIDEYARAHPSAVTVVRRRLELLREAGDAASSESQCAHSRAKTESAPDATRLELLTACVALHPDNTDGRSDLMDYAEYLPNLSTAEDALYRTNLAQRCVEKVGDEEARCAQACACVDKNSGKPPTAPCKRACGGCRNETAQRLRLCRRIGEAPHPTAHAARTKTAPAESAP